jgi:polyisoprenyl-phosphate glycosyltransferase
VVVPVYRDGASLDELWRRVRDTLAKDYPRFELILVDDGSPDDSWTVIEALSKTDDRVKGVRLSRNFGQHPAIAAGFDRATGDVIVLMDADLEDQPESLPQIIGKLSPEIDVVYTIKEGERGGPLHRLTSHVFHQVFARVARTNVPADVGTLRAFNRKVLAAIGEHREFNVLFGPLMFYIGFPSVFVKVTRDTRTARPSTYTFRKRLALAARSLISYTDLPHRIFTMAGAMVLAGASLYAAVVLVQYFLSPARLPPGLTLIALLMLLFMGVTMIGIGIVGAYVFRVYQEVLDRPRYLVASQLNITATVTPNGSVGHDKGKGLDVERS